MKKLRLRVDELQVEQFQVDSASPVARGTVRGLMTETCQCTPGTQYCGDSMNANTEPCRFCPEMPITYTCDACG